MSNVTGRIEKVMMRPTKTGGYSYSLKVGDKFYSFGFKDPMAKEGDFVSFDTKPSARDPQYTDGILASLKKATPPAEAMPSFAAHSPAKAAWVPDAARQDSISYQAARNSALQFLELVHAAGALDLGKGKNKADAVEILEGYLDHYTNSFFEATKVLGKAPKKAAAPVSEAEPFNDEIGF